MRGYLDNYDNGPFCSPAVPIERCIINSIRGIYNSNDPMHATECVEQLIKIVDELIKEKRLTDVQKGNLIIAIEHAFTDTIFMPYIDFPVEEYKKSFLRPSLIYYLTAFVNLVVDDPEICLIYNYTYDSFNTALSLIRSIIENDVSSVLSYTKNIKDITSMIDKIRNKRIHEFKVWWMFREILEWKIGDYLDIENANGPRSPEDENKHNDWFGASANVMLQDADDAEEGNGQPGVYDSRNLNHWLKEQDLYEKVSDELFNAPNGYLTYAKNLLGIVTAIVEEGMKRWSANIYPIGNDLLKDMFFCTDCLNNDQRNTLRLLVVRNLLPSNYPVSIIRECTRLFLNTDEEEFEETMNIPLEMSIRILEIEGNKKLKEAQHKGDIHHKNNQHERELDAEGIFEDELLGLAVKIIVNNINSMNHGLKAISALETHIELVEEHLKKCLPIVRDPFVKDKICKMLAERGLSTNRFPRPAPHSATQPNSANLQRRKKKI